MGRRLNVSTPTVINTELRPLDDSFYIEATGGGLQQWYNDNIDAYSPDRSVTPLVLTPHVSAIDTDTMDEYTPSFYTEQTRWFERYYDTASKQYVEREIGNNESDYAKIGLSLFVRKNVPYTSDISIRCEAVYIDPRDAGLTHGVVGVVTLSTNRDAESETPSLSINTPKSQSFNPIVDNEIVNNEVRYKSMFTFEASAIQGYTIVTNNICFEWYGVDGTTEVLVETLPWYVSGQHTKTLVVDAMYGEEIRIVLRAKETESSETLYPDKVYRSICWRTPDIDTNVVSKNGAAARGTDTNMEFETVINTKHDVLDEKIANDNLCFNWKTRKSHTQIEVDEGWGAKQDIPTSRLRSVSGSTSSMSSTLVFPYVYMLGAYEKIMEDGVEVTDDGNTVFDRSVY